MSKVSNFDTRGTNRGPSKVVCNQTAKPLSLTLFHNGRAEFCCSNVYCSAIVYALYHRFFSAVSYITIL